MVDLAKHFDAKAIEARWTQFWENSAEATPTVTPGGDSFSVFLPPPNVTGTLHMGHAFNQTIMDALTRYHRMLGCTTLWVPGTDHAGIATQIVVERQLNAQGLTRQEVGREKFVESVWRWKHDSGKTITDQMRRLGASVSWDHEYFTMSSEMSETVNLTFERLFEEGLIYRGKRMVQWDPILSSAVSDLEVDSLEEDGTLWHIAYQFADGTGEIVVATTRPETILGDVAVMVHPSDIRYAEHVSKQVRLPITGRLVPIIADDYVDISFGTGAVKVTPAHDGNDYLVAQRHGLPILCVLDRFANIIDDNVSPENVKASDIGIPLILQGTDRFVAREYVVSFLRDSGLMRGEAAHKLMVPRCGRTGAIVEPMLTDQWFVAVSKPTRAGPSLAQSALNVVQNGSVRFTPAQWTTTYTQWLNNIQDWCISRQLWWGHRIPAWYGETGEVFVAINEQSAFSKAEASGYFGPLKQDEDVLDTWYSASLIPFSSLGWPNETPELSKFLPSSVLVTGFDIIFFWVARMIMMTTHFTEKVPFRDVYIHGLVRDASGAKMSKSEGNVLDPVDLIDGIDLNSLLSKRSSGLRRPETAGLIREITLKEFPDGIPSFGADATRLTFASLASLGRNINFDVKRCQGYRNFCNKVWNASLFVIRSCNGEAFDMNRTQIRDGKYEFRLSDNLVYSYADLWIIDELRRAESTISDEFDAYRLDNVTATIYKLFWEDFCDWYLEIAKLQLRSKKIDVVHATRQTLIFVLDRILRLLHPIAPFITSEIWHTLMPVARVDVGSSESLMSAPYPRPRPPFKESSKATEWMASVKGIVGAFRTLRSQMRLEPSVRAPACVFGILESPEQSIPIFQLLANLADVRILTDQDEFERLTSTSPVSTFGSVRLSIQTLLDLSSERKRLEREIDLVVKNLSRCQEKLSDALFMKKAPASIVRLESERFASFTLLRSELQKKLDSLIDVNELGDRT